ncbi:MAG: 50S ribosomal protein L11 methyltransferase [Deltaproteobacteria bacterium]|nr:50S ribosomal protein L11 methyltransferase [Deltaproteobacteria bacterium]
MIKTWFEIEARGHARGAESAAAVLIAFGSPGILELEEDKDGEKIIKAYIPADTSLNKNRMLLRQGLKKFGWTYTGGFFENADWLTKWKEHIKPIRISHRLTIKPTWKRVAQQSGRIIVEIDPGMAFGTGSHASTAMCLRAADKLSREIQGKRVLDVGTGSAALAITAAKLGARKVVGLDIDPEAVKVARKNVKLNNVGKNISITGRPLEKIKGDYFIIFANIIAEELVKIAPLLTERLQHNGFLILSGILKERVQDVRIAYRREGLNPFKAYTKGEWACLIFRKTPLLRREGSRFCSKA